MTLQHYAAFKVIGSPFIVGGVATPEDAFVFLWHVWAKYSPNNRKAKRKLARVCRCFMPSQRPSIFPKRREKQDAKKLLRFIEVQEAIQKYVAETMQDRPPVKDGDNKSFFSYAAALCHDFASEYGWPEHVTLNIPLKRLFQYCKIITAQKKTKAGMRPVFFNPSDSIYAKVLAEGNKN